MYVFVCSFSSLATTDRIPSVSSAVSPMSGPYGCPWSRIKVCMFVNVLYSVEVV